MILYNFFHDFIHVCIPREGADNPLGTKFWCQQEPLVTSVICCKFQKISLKSDFIQKMFISRGRAPRGQSFDVNRYILSLHLFLASLKDTPLKSDFILFFFFSWFNTCSPGAGAEGPQGTTFWCQQKGLITFPFCCKFQSNLFEVWFYTIVFMI